MDPYDEDYDPVKDTAEWAEKLLGKIHIFEDGDKLEVVQVKRRDKMIMMAEEFDVTYGHLFGLREAETK